MKFLNYFTIFFLIAIFYKMSFIFTIIASINKMTDSAIYLFSVRGYINLTIFTTSYFLMPKMIYQSNSHGVFK